MTRFPATVVRHVGFRSGQVGRYKFEIGIFYVGSVGVVREVRGVNCQSLPFEDGEEVLLPGELVWSPPPPGDSSEEVGDGFAWQVGMDCGVCGGWLNSDPGWARAIFAVEEGPWAVGAHGREVWVAIRA